MFVKSANDVNRYGYKNSICIDADLSFTRHHVATTLNVHYDYIMADSVYSLRMLQDLLNFGGLESP